MSEQQTELTSGKPGSLGVGPAVPSSSDMPSEPVAASMQELMKLCAQETVHFAPGTTWLCFSDQVMHAAVSGQYMFEQTIHLPVAALYEPSRSPLAILERLTGRALAR